ncbi:MAG: glycosyltransferase family 9 protein [Elusimicrobia bacterium]|nr:glycosyltransferase family 9 protein [Elusimicrobiota bacterium]
MRYFFDLARALWLRLKLMLSPAPVPVEIRRVLVLGYAAIGDLIFFLPALESLRRHYPKAKITFLANPYPTTRELLPATGLVDEIWLHEWEGPFAAAQRIAINRRIAAGEFDLAVLTLSSPAHYFQEGLSVIPLRAGHCRIARWPLWPVRLWRTLKQLLVIGEPVRRLLLNRIVWIEPDFEHAVRRNLRLIEALGLPVEAASRPALPVKTPAGLKAPEGAKRIGVHLGPPNNQYHKIWDAERFGGLCAALARAYGAEIALVGTEDERDSVERVARLCPQASSWVGKTSLLETFAVIASCDLFISCDTGLAKAALVLGVPTVTLWGLSTPEELGAYWDRERHLDIRTGIACHPCARLGMAMEDRLNYRVCGHHDCIAKLELDFVLARVLEKYPAPKMVS